jgi:hypothetical protein
MTRRSPPHIPTLHRSWRPEPLPVPRPIEKIQIGASRRPSGFGFFHHGNGDWGSAIAIPLLLLQRVGRAKQAAGELSPDRGVSLCKPEPRRPSHGERPMVAPMPQEACSQLMCLDEKWAATSGSSGVTDSRQAEAMAAERARKRDGAWEMPRRVRRHEPAQEDDHARAHPFQHPGGGEAGEGGAEREREADRVYAPGHGQPSLIGGMHPRAESGSPG